MGKFLDKHNLKQLNYKEIDIHGRPIASKEIESISKEKPVIRLLHWEFYHFKKNQNQSFWNFPKILNGGNNLQLIPDAITRGNKTVDQYLLWIFMQKYVTKY